VIGMVPGARRTGISSSSFIRLLAELTAVDVAQSRQSFVERLASWLDWTDAIALSAVLNGAEAGTAEAQSTASWPASAAAETSARLRHQLTRSITTDAVFTSNTPAPAALIAGNDEFLPYRRSYATHQRAMAMRIGALRSDVRAALAKSSPALSRLAALDTVMEEVLGARERSLLATVPALLEKRFARLRQAQQEQQPPQHQQPAAWQTLFGQEMQSVLLAELDLRWQPIDGLLAALAPKGTRLQ
jgi:Protein of unknown function (DUF3348)